MEWKKNICLITGLCFFIIIMQGDIREAGAGKIISSGKKKGKTAGSDKGIVQDKNGAYYVVQKGDTFWSLSQRFRNSDWVLEQRLFNPDLIYVGQRIRLFSRKKNDKNEALGSVPLQEEFIPASQHGQDFSDDRPSVFSSEEYDAGDALSEANPSYYFYPSISRVGFVTEKPFPSLGVIFKSKDDREMISKGDIVYIKESGTTPFNVSRYYTTYQIREIQDEETGRGLGTQHYLTGVVEITERTPQFAVGRVMQSFRPILLNDFLMPYITQEPNIPMTASVKGLEGKIIAAEDFSSILGQHSIAFIDKGEKDGVVPGQQYQLYYQEKARPRPDSEQEVLLSPVEFGTLLVLRTQEAVSTVLIIQSDKTVLLGTKFHAP